MGSFGFSVMFSIIPIFIMGVFLLIVGTIVFRAVQGGRQWHRNNQSPVLTVHAKVVAKRMSVSSYRHHNHHHGDIHMSNMRHSTTYFATFEFESGDRLEFVVADQEYGYLVEGDMGRLTFQGTRYQGFERGAMNAVHKE